MKKRIIHPFVGENYSSGIRGYKTMILGESSYGANANNEGYDIENQTINVGMDAIGYEEGRGYWNKSRFYTRITRMFGYEARNFEQRKEFWNSVLYYNFLQIVLTKARVAPPEESWIEAKVPFLETLDEFKPDLVICYSKRMWGRLPKNNEKNVPNELNLPCRTAVVNNPDGYTPRLIGFNHPTARGFKWQHAAELLKTLAPAQ